MLISLNYATTTMCQLFSEQPLPFGGTQAELAGDQVQHKCTVLELQRKEPIMPP
jgi:hypothetical protein